MPVESGTEEKEERGKAEVCESPPSSIQFGSKVWQCDGTPEKSLSTSGLMSLPWEMVSHIASHLPAQCIISVLPQVCRTLGQVCKDNSAWQLRAQRLTGPLSSFPVGSTSNFDWPRACLEMENLIECWLGQNEPAERKVIKLQGEVSENEFDQEVQEVGAEGQPGPAQEQIQLGIEGNPVRRNEEEEKEEENNMRDEKRENAAMVDNEAVSGLDVKTNLNPSLEHILLSSGNDCDVITVLLVGGEGSLCVSGSKDYNVNLWDVRRGSNGKLLGKLGPCGINKTSHKGWVNCLAANRDLLASGSFDSTVKLWDLNCLGAERGTIRNTAPVLALSFQDHMLFVASHDKTVRIYDTRAAELLVKSFRSHNNRTLCLAIDEQYILSGSNNKTLTVFDFRAGKILEEICLNSCLISMSYSERTLWAGGKDGLLHTFSMNEGSFKSVAQFNVGHTASLFSMHHSPGTLYTCSYDRTLKVHLPCAPPKTLCTLRFKDTLTQLSVEAGVLAVSCGENVEVFRPRK